MIVTQRITIAVGSWTRLRIERWRDLEIPGEGKTTAGMATKRVNVSSSTGIHCFFSAPARAVGPYHTP